MSLIGCEQPRGHPPLHLVFISRNACALPARRPEEPRFFAIFPWPRLLFSGAVRHHEEVSGQRSDMVSSPSPLHGMPHQTLCRLVLHGTPCWSGLPSQAEDHGDKQDSGECRWQDVHAGNVRILRETNLAELARSWYQGLRQSHFVSMLCNNVVRPCVGITPPLRLLIVACTKFVQVARCGGVGQIYTKKLERCSSWFDARVRGQQAV